ncbi:MAG: hypothetical protein A3J75_02635 [Acidobacteria bacterium RBG_16_68_9]|nr:MAG: hypothetical protein A3J75_02635 [Acidobacteria bacterium RBG_16_68_9]
MLKGSTELEKELRKWREARARKQNSDPAPNDRRTVPAPNDRRTVRVKGQEVVVITKPKRHSA